jgi:hypothetical protein
MSRTEDKARENRLRRMAERQGLWLEKCRRRDPLALGYGTYQVVSDQGEIVAGEIGTGYGLTLDDVEHYLTRGRKS